MTTLPVAGRAHVRRAALGLIRADRRAVLLMVLLNALAAVAGLAGPWLLGRIVDTVVAGHADVRVVDELALAILLCTVAQTLLARSALAVGCRWKRAMYTPTSAVGTKWWAVSSRASRAQPSAGDSPGSRWPAGVLSLRPCEVCSSTSRKRPSRSITAATVTLGFQRRSDMAPVPSFSAARSR